MIYSPETPSLSNKHLFSPYCVPGHGVIQISKLWLCPSGVLQGRINNYYIEAMNCYRGALKDWRKRRAFFLICSHYLECLDRGSKSFASKSVKKVNENEFADHLLWMRMNLLSTYCAHLIFVYLENSESCRKDIIRRATFELDFEG